MMKNFFNSLKLLKGQKQYYFVIALGFILVFIVVVIAVLSFQQPNQTTTKVYNALPTPVTQLIPPTVAPNTNPPVSIDQVASRRLVHNEEYRVQLSPSDFQAKQKILQLLPTGQDSGTVYSSSNVTIDYIQAFDLFKGEILTVDVASAKSDAENWFKSQGMSQRGLCELPLGFYLNWDIANSLRDAGFTFSPLPDGC